MPNRNKQWVATRSQITASWDCHSLMLTRKKPNIFLLTHMQLFWLRLISFSTVLFEKYNVAWNTCIYKMYESRVSNGE